MNESEISQQETIDTQSSVNHKTIEPLNPTDNKPPTQIHKQQRESDSSLIPTTLSNPILGDEKVNKSNRVVLNKSNNNSDNKSLSLKLSDHIEKSSSSISTVDSLEEVIPNCKSTSKNIQNQDKILSPVNEKPEGIINSSMTFSVNNTEMNPLDNDNKLTTEKNLKRTNHESNSGNEPPEQVDGETAEAAATSNQNNSSMAFIIAFDNDDDDDELTNNSPTNKKKLNIGDSIRQFAPPKPDSIEKPRPPKITNVLKEKDKIEKSSHHSPTMFSSNRTSTAMGNRSGKNKLPAQQKVSTKELPKVKQIVNSSDSNYMIQRFLYNQVMKQSNNINSDKHQMAKSNLNDNLNNEFSFSSSSSTPTPTTPSPSKDDISPVDKDLAVLSDDKSETGTYTIETEHQDPDLDEARKKIDQVFGVMGYGEIPSVFSSDESPETSLINTIGNNVNNNWMSNQNHSKLPPAGPVIVKAKQSPQMARRQYLTKEDMLNPNPTPSPSPTQLQINSATFTRSKRSTPTLPPINSTVHYEGDENHSADEKFIQNNGLTSQNCKNNNNVIRSPASIRRNSGENQQSKSAKYTFDINGRRKMSLTLSNSDVDSYNSDDSISLRSSNSNLNDGNMSSSSVPNSKMRFNKAFALRRARLGLETPGIPLDKKKDTNKAKPPSGSASFSRNDGGRFSLRAPSGGLNNKRQNTFSRSSVSSDAPKIPIQRKASDPSHVNGRLYKNASSDNEYARRRNLYSGNKNSNRIQNDLQKSASFANSHLSDCSSNISSKHRLNQIQNQLMINRMLVNKNNENAARSSPTSPSRSSDQGIMTQSLTERVPYTRESLSSQIGSIKTVTPTLKSRELSALDSLVVSAINQLSFKMRENVRIVLEKERTKYQMGSEARLMIDEFLPQIYLSEKRLGDNNDSNLSKDLSNTLKNLRKVDQSLEGKLFIFIFV